MGAPNDLTRSCEPGDSSGCHWCGQIRRRLFRYGGLRGRFCNFGCFSSYHDVPRSDFDYIHPEVD